LALILNHGKSSNNSLTFVYLLFVIIIQISYADFFVVSITEEIKLHNLGLDAYPLLSAHLSRVLARPRIAAYVADPSRHPSGFARFIPK
jgi:Glutathione S-transferase, C-terminal domain